METKTGISPITLKTPAGVPNRPYGPVDLCTPARNWYYLITQTMIAEYFKNIQNQVDIQETAVGQKSCLSQIVRNQTCEEKTLLLNNSR